MNKLNEKDIIDKIIYNIPIENKNIYEIKQFQNLIQEEIRLSHLNSKKIKKLKNKYSNLNNSQVILPLIYLNLKKSESLYLKNLEILNNALEKCIEKKCQHNWVEDIYEDMFEREIKIKYCLICGNCHKII